MNPHLKINHILSVEFLLRSPQSEVAVITWHMSACRREGGTKQPEGRLNHFLQCSAGSELSQNHSTKHLTGLHIKNAVTEGKKFKPYTGHSNTD